MPFGVDPMTRPPMMMQGAFAHTSSSAVAIVHQIDYHVENHISAFVNGFFAVLRWTTFTWLRSSKRRASCDDGHAHATNRARSVAAS